MSSPYQTKCAMCEHYEGDHNPECQACAEEWAKVHGEESSPQTCPFFEHPPQQEEHEMPDRKTVCPICGGEGWTDGSAVIRGEHNKANAHDTTCVGCDGSGVVKWRKGVSNNGLRS